MRSRGQADRRYGCRHATPMAPAPFVEMLPRPGSAGYGEHTEAPSGVGGDAATAARPRAATRGAADERPSCPQYARMRTMLRKGVAADAAHACLYAPTAPNAEVARR